MISNCSNSIFVSRDYKLLRKIEKLNRNGIEKKFEKLDSKFEKLENKTKRLLEKKSQSKSRCEKKEKSTETINVVERKPSNDISVTCSLMDATLLERPPVVHIHPGRHFLKVWHVMNNGSLPWTDKTELRLSWGTPGLEFEKTIVKCPRLKPGQKGRISVRGQAPDFSGNFECYWHFYHMGERFGHWLDCLVVVENFESPGFMNPNLDPFRLRHELEKAKKEQSLLAESLSTFKKQRSPKSKKDAKKDEVSNAEDLNKNESKSSSMASETVKENQRKIDATIVEIRKMLDDVTLMPVPPTKNKILEMVGVNEESDNPDDLIDIDCITGKNIEPAEWKALQQLHPEFMKSCDMLRKLTIGDPFPEPEVKEVSKENYCTLKRDCSARDLMHFSYGDNDLDKPQDISESFTKNIPGVYQPNQGRGVCNLLHDRPFPSRTN